ncbi:MAG: efflux RND transporter permease subunit, partial [Myxococcota bacterium]
SILHVEIKDAIFDLDQVWDEVRLKVDEAQTELPAGIPTPVVDTDFGDVAAVTAALSGPDYTLAELFDLAKHARDRLQSVPGTKKVEILGGVDERIYVELDEAKLTELQLSPDVLAAQLRARNVLGARGTLASGGRRLLVQPTGSFNELSALRALLVELPGGRSVPLDEIATVSHGYQDPPPRLAYVDGVRSLILSVSMNSEERVLEYAPRVIERIEEIRGMVPVGVELTVFNYQADAVARAVFGVTLNVGETLGIVLAVVILFLGLRTGLIVGAIVPSVMLITLGVMGFVGMDLQRMSLATLVIALGLLVDNGIVVAEDFKRRLEAGAHRDAALSQVGRELAWPLFSSTLTTILVFLPLMLAENVAGEYTRSISQVILISLLTSWLLAMTLTPLLCHRFIRLRPARSGNGGFETLNRHYGTVLRHILRRPLSFLAGMAVLLVVAGAAMSAVPKRFFPDSDRSEVLVYLDLSPDAGVEATDAAVRRLMARLEDRAEFPYVDRYAAYVGFGGPRFVLSLTPMDPAPNRAFLVVNARSLEDVDATIASLRKAIQEELPEAEGRVARMFLGPSDSTKIEVQVKGPDAEVVFGASSRLEAILRDV